MLFPLELLFGLLLFAFVTSVTPGPNNMMLLASGVNFGVRRTVPHMLGISIGHAFMVFCVGLGIAAIFEAEPRLNVALKVVGALYMLWLAWKIAHAAAPEGAGTQGRPFTFLQAAAFQWVNPKAWAMALVAVSAYAPSPSAWGVGLVAIVFGLVNLPSVGMWAALGQGLRVWLEEPRRRRVFNIAMAVLLVLSIVPFVA